MTETSSPFDGAAFPSTEDTSRDAHTSSEVIFLQCAFQRAGAEGWHRFSLVEAAYDAKLSLDDVRRRFPFKPLLLLKLSSLADEGALREDGYGSVREKLFDLFMRRFDVFQDYRAGLQAVKHAALRDPALAALLGAITLGSMRWMAEAAGIDGAGLGGALRIKALAGSWVYAARAWERDESADLGSTMSALEKALDKVERLGVLKPSPRQKMNEAMRPGGLPDHPLAAES